MGHSAENCGFELVSKQGPGPSLISNGTTLPGASAAPTQALACAPMCGLPIPKMPVKSVRDLCLTSTLTASFLLIVLLVLVGKQLLSTNGTSANDAFPCWLLALRELFAADMASGPEAAGLSSS